MRCEVNTYGFPNLPLVKSNTAVVATAVHSLKQYPGFTLEKAHLSADTVQDANNPT